MSWLKKVKEEAEVWFDIQLNRKYERYKEGATSAALDDLIKECEKNTPPPFTKDDIDAVARDLIGAGTISCILSHRGRNSSVDKSSKSQAAYPGSNLSGVLIQVTPMRGEEITT